MYSCLSLQSRRRKADIRGNNRGRDKRGVDKRGRDDRRRYSEERDYMENNTFDPVPSEMNIDDKEKSKTTSALTISINQCDLEVSRSLFFEKPEFKHGSW